MDNKKASRRANGEDFPRQLIDWTYPARLQEGATASPALMYIILNYSEWRIPKPVMRHASVEATHLVN